MCVLSIQVPIRKKSGNLFNDPHIYIYIYIYIYINSVQVFICHKTRPTIIHESCKMVIIKEKGYRVTFINVHCNFSYLAKRLECLPIVGRLRFNTRSSYTRHRKWYLIHPCLTLSIIRYGSRVNLSNPGKGVTPSPTTRCCSNWKGNIQATLD